MANDTQDLLELLQAGVALQTEGRLAKAAACYRTLLDRDPRHAEAWHLLGVVLYQMDQVDLGMDYVRRAIRINSRFAAYHSNLALMLQAQDRLEDAEVRFKRALGLEPNNGDVLYKLGHLLQRQGRLREAADRYRKVLQLCPEHVEAHCNLSTTLHSLGETAEAMEHIRRTLFLEPGLAEAHYNLGTFLQADGLLPDAVESYEKAISLNPDYAEAHSNLGIVLGRIGRAQECLLCHRRAVALAPNNARFHLNLGLALCSEDKPEEGGAHFEQVLALTPQSAEAHYNLGLSFVARNRLDEAIAHYLRAIEIDPTYWEAHNNLGNALEMQHQGHIALDHYNKALQLNPQSADVRYNLGTCHLRLGDMAEGWRGYEWRWQAKTLCQGPREFSQSQWRGEPLEGRRILIHAEQGLGDTIQFLRYVPMIRQIGCSVVLEVPGQLVRLAGQVDGVTEIVAAGDALPAFDLQCPMLSLPLAFGTTAASIPNRIPYLSVPQEARAKAAALAWPSEGIKVGIVWAGTQTYLRDIYRYRSISLAMLEPLFHVPDVRLIALQLGEARQQLAVFSDVLFDISPLISDMADTAAYLEHLDLVISVDTSVAHLAAALGVETWVMLPYSADWRWGDSARDSPWYPTMRLFRQDTPGDWRRVVDEVARALAELAGRSSAAASSYSCGRSA